MSETTARWARQTWDDYADQLKATIPTPNIGPYESMATMRPTVTYTCPFCLQRQSGIQVVQQEGAEEFTVTWRGCGHSVAVDA
ncbi:hypothetical protein [Streptomyces sp. NBC_00566]|uniref:hypothetical protein n=1 Tax=Streptomyces sp. NBC_00566 TaxID=2975778 RepID=UPI002E814A24|nr:hypothetical protein [Streptomyces sp. NBC_00566]WUB88249.1 hypothetical protein OG812_17370 [Streptomyces sp. NBC_00566]